MKSLLKQDKMSRNLRELSTSVPNRSILGTVDLGYKQINCLFILNMGFPFTLCTFLGHNRECPLHSNEGHVTVG